MTTIEFVWEANDDLNSFPWYTKTGGRFRDHLPYDWWHTNFRGVKRHEFWPSSRLSGAKQEICWVDKSDTPMAWNRIRIIHSGRNRASLKQSISTSRIRLSLIKALKRTVFFQYFTSIPFAFFLNDRWWNCLNGIRIPNWFPTPCCPARHNLNI